MKYDVGLERARHAHAQNKYYARDDAAVNTSATS